MEEKDTSKETHNEIKWDIIISEESRHHTILIKWNEVSKLENWKWDKDFYSIYYDSHSPITTPKIQFFESEKEISPHENLVIKLSNLRSLFLSPADSYFSINLKELNDKLKLNLFTKKKS